MKATYDLNANGCLIITADSSDRKAMREIRRNAKRLRLGDSAVECEALENLIANSEIDWVAPEDIGALTSAPILGIRDEEGKVIAAWGFMDYCLRSFVDDLIKTGKAVFVS